MRLISSLLLALSFFCSIARADTTQCSNASGNHQYLFLIYEGGVAPRTPQNYGRDRLFVNDIEVQGQIEFLSKQVLTRSQDPQYKRSTYLASVNFTVGTQTTSEYLICDESIYIGIPRP